MNSLEGKKAKKARGKADQSMTLSCNVIRGSSAKAPFIWQMTGMAIGRQQREESPIVCLNVFVIFETCAVMPHSSKQRNRASANRSARLFSM